MSISYLERPVYAFAQVDDLLRLGPGTARRWVDGYRRGGRTYPPVVRETSTGSDVVTWGEFVETRLLATYRDSGVPMQRLRPVVEGLRQTLGVRYPLATVRPYVDESRRLVHDLQEEAQLEDSMRLVVEAGGGQLVFSTQVRHVERSTVFATQDSSDAGIALRVAPLGRERAVALDPRFKSGQPAVRSVPTDVLTELVHAGEPVEWVAQQYDLTLEQVLDALEYERRGQQAA
ncbi:DUF433 domain-containing protein [Pseudokineococcus sp. 1T1Z-3]|uniref:DUF433 domain-containing protein n=1 Tax=Pseudokineococcus sp. 1T1Z-3 TaxID=3132745 RepID=UPI0030A1D91C